jgi:trimeric autotransporter adhesin
MIFFSNLLLITVIQKPGIMKLKLTTTSFLDFFLSHLNQIIMKLLKAVFILAAALILHTEARAQQTTGTIPKFDATPPALINSVIIEDASKIGIGMTPTYKLDVSGNLRTSQDALINGITVGKGLNSHTYSTALGYNALNSTTTGGQNTAIGYASGSNITSGILNTSVGYASLYASAGSTSSGSTALGAYAMQYWQTGYYNIGIGYDAMHGTNSTTGGTGAGNIAIGRQAMGASNPSGNYNVALGYVSLPFVTSGANNIAVGYNAGYTSTTGSSNILIGTSANASSATASNELNIGNWIYGTGGSIGIGAASPENKLQITHGTSGNSGLRFTNLTSASTAAASSGKVLSVDANGDVVLEQASIPSHWGISVLDANTIINNNSGGVIVGTGVTTLSSGYKLYVTDGIITEKVKVKLKAAWPDYVFAKDYKLLSLKETEDFIKSNNHLPGVISANEVEKEGLELGESNAVLLKKIEELMLYMIEADKEIKNLQQKVKVLETKN